VNIANIPSQLLPNETNALTEPSEPPPSSFTSARLEELSQQRYPGDRPSLKVAKAEGPNSVAIIVAKYARLPASVLEGLIHLTVYESAPNCSLV
jgi:hypothetical protein